MKGYVGNHCCKFVGVTKTLLPFVLDESEQVLGPVSCN